LRQGCSGALKKRPLSGSEKTPFQQKKRFLSGLENAFSGRQDAQNCIKVVVVP